MTETYTAASVLEFGKPLSFEQKAFPKLGPKDALVKLIASGICHSDVHIVDGDWPAQPPLPSVPGHEGIGEVVAVGSDVTDVEIGDLLGNAWNNRTCGECEFCSEGWETVCEKQVISGYGIDGSFAEYMVVDTVSSARIPVTVDPIVAAPLLCAGVTVYKGIKQSKATPGTWFAVVGVGGLGHLAVQYAKAMGYRVIAVDINEEALALAVEHGAEAAVNSSQADAIEQIRAIAGNGPQTILVAATHHSAYELAIKAVRRRGTIVCIGVPPKEVPVHMADVVSYALTLQGSTVGTRRDIEEAIDFHARGLVNPTVSSCTFAEVNDVLNDLRAGKARGRTVIDFSK